MDDVGPFNFKNQFSILHSKTKVIIVLKTIELIFRFWFNCNNWDYLCSLKQYQTIWFLGRKFYSCVQGILFEAAYKIDGCHGITISSEFSFWTITRFLCSRNGSRSCGRGRWRRGCRGRRGRYHITFQWTLASKIIQLVLIKIQLYFIISFLKKQKYRLFSRFFLLNFSRFFPYSNPSN